MKRNSLLRSALATVMVGSLAMSATLAAAQSVSGHSRGGERKQESPGRKSSPRTDQRQNKERRSSSHERSAQSGRVSDQNRHRQAEDKRRKESQARAEQDRKRKEQAKRAEDSRRRESANRARQVQNRERQEAAKRAEEQRRRESANRARQVQNREREEAAKRARSNEARRREAGRIDKITGGQRYEPSRGNTTVGRITNNKLRNQNQAREAANRRYEEERRRAAEHARRDRERREERNRQNRWINLAPRAQTVSSLSGRTYRHDDWDRYRPVAWDRIVVVQPHKHHKPKKHAPPLWSNARHHRDRIFVADARPVYYHDRYDDRYDDWQHDGHRYDDVVFADDYSWDRGYDWQFADDPYLSSNGYTSWQDAYDRRQEKKNEWRNIAYLAGAVMVYGLLNKDETLTFAGGAGALYSLHRYEEDRKSQNELKRLRADYFSRPYFHRDGVRYDRRLVTKNGERYYQFVRL